MRKAIEQYKQGLEQILLSGEKEYCYERRLGIYRDIIQLTVQEKIGILQELKQLEAWLKQNEAQ